MFIILLDFFKTSDIIIIVKRYITLYTTLNLNHKKYRRNQMKTFFGGMFMNKENLRKLKKLINMR